MTITAILGTSSVTKIVFALGMLMVIGDFAATLFAIAYRRFIYKKRRASYDPSYTPPCSIVVPCKGIPKNFGDNLRGFLQFDYPDYEVIYVTESAADAAVPEIEKILSEDKRAKFTVAGLSTRCAQKNHNMLAALREARSDSEVFVFADSDIKPGVRWLREIVLPLQSGKISVTTGFRWLLSAKGTIGELCHAYVNIFIYTCFCAASYLGGVGLWGGTMAVRRKDYVELGVEKAWSRAAVDDMSLSTLVLKNRRKAVVVADCITTTDDLLPTVGATIAWFERQIMYLKSYQRVLWVFPALPMALLAGWLILLLPYAAFAPYVTAEPTTFMEQGGGASLIFILGHTAVAMLYPALGKMPFFGRFLLFQPVLRLAQMVSYFKTWTTRTITWAGIKYKLDFKGDVREIDRGSA
ncbi:MAG: glycosyltransferase [Chitinispirillales bacterium]|nr:glycosyltransferase [Chitinispirillales bacterium]